MTDFKHISIMAEQCINGLNINPTGCYADGTTGGGGHSLLIAEQLTSGKLLCFDRDQEALDAAKIRLCKHLDKIIFIKSNFAHMKDRVKELGIPGVDGILLDLGVSSYQLDNSQRGFSYMQDAPLDMRMDQGQAFSAMEVVNSYPLKELSRIFFEYGEEKYSNRVAQAIVARREVQPIATTLELVDIIRNAMPAAARREKQHPAKRVFQAIRIEVNEELAAVKQAVESGIDILNPKGRIVVMSFHSLEDRIVKQMFVEKATGCICPKTFPVCVCNHKPVVEIVSRKVITAATVEVEENPRARSAKLRIAEKV